MYVHPSGVSKLFSTKEPLEISNIIHGSQKITNLKMILLQIYAILSPACCCLGRVLTNDSVSLLWPLAWTFATLITCKTECVVNALPIVFQLFRE